ncbi:thiamine phosphate synthase [Tamlana fucoidanivorans]|uniref:Thiamine phosphate synthase n=1 Tax=Allotamlana fucoidanivorans TaxID=2583814 RepID=A0A5C4SS64_9FLAO|nr:thiamine phosphate synthase [Tamlana fucoidanivorans]TNJ47095.1 thiamine phosphate synthase [Tamlana fucoidanivorans]
MIVLIAPETDIPNEIEILHQLFQAGLQYYHLRKPKKDGNAYCDYLNQIDSKYHDRIILHQHHKLVANYNLKGIHFQEAQREAFDLNGKTPILKTDFLNDYVQLLHIESAALKGKTISASFHEPEHIENCALTFDYHLLSPVFSSISKTGYQGRGFDVNQIDKNIVGMGGVTTKNLKAFTTLGFKGVGVLGGIWQSGAPISNFKIMQNYFTTVKSYI